MRVTYNDFKASCKKSITFSLYADGQAGDEVVDFDTVLALLPEHADPFLKPMREAIVFHAQGLHWRSPMQSVQYDSKYRAAVVDWERSIHAQIDRWDIRHVDGLAAAFPSRVPARSRGKLIDAGMNGKGEWVIEFTEIDPKAPPSIEAPAAPTSTRTPDSNEPR